MNYPYQIKTFEAYQEEYKRSVEEPEAFWASIAEHFTWKKKMGSGTCMEFLGTRC